MVATPHPRPAPRRTIPIYYTPGYDLNLGNHVFPSQKYALIHQQLLGNGHFRPADFLAPPEATDNQLSLVHTLEYLRKVRTGDFTLQEILRLEISHSPELARACLLSAGGTIQACEMAKEQGMAVNLGGGFHHAYAGHGEGFCVLNDIAAGIACSLVTGHASVALVVDCDVHQGNGTASIFQSDPRVFTLSLHQENNYPFPKERSSLDVGLEDGTGDEKYLSYLSAALDEAFRRHRPDLMVYVAGADPYIYDQLGGLSLSMAGLRRRDEMVLARAAAEGCAAVVTLAGGYARSVDDTVSIHVNTILQAQRQFEKRQVAG